MDTFAEKLSKLRKRAGFKQEDFALEVGVSVDTVRRWEGDKQEPRLGDLRRIATVLQTPISSLVGENIDSTTDTTQEKVIKPHLSRKTRKEIIVIQQGNTRVEIPATSQGYAILKDKLKEVSINQDTSIINTEY